MSLGNVLVANRLPSDIANLGWRLATVCLKASGCQASRCLHPWQGVGCQALPSDGHDEGMVTYG